MKKSLKTLIIALVCVGAIIALTACSAAINTADGKAAADLYSISTGGATADYSAAKAGREVTLTPVVPDGQEFIRWVTVPENIKIENNKFIMPASDVSIGAAYGFVTNEGLTVTATGNSTYSVTTVNDTTWSASWSDVEASGYSAVDVDLGGTVPDAPTAKFYAITFYNHGEAAVEMRVDMKTSSGVLLNGVRSHGAPDGDFFNVAAGQTVTYVSKLKYGVSGTPANMSFFLDSCRWELKSVKKSGNITVSNISFLEAWEHHDLYNYSDRQY